MRIPDPTAEKFRFEDLYRDLKGIARSRLHSVGGRTYLDTTALVHDTYSRLAQANEKNFPSKGQFLAYCGQVMRSVIIDTVRAAGADRRGGANSQVTLTTELLDSHAVDAGSEKEILGVHAALSQLKTIDPKLESIVELKYFAGMTEAEVALALGMSERSVSREWERARALLRALLTD
jgi:RNA polymerase sigma factor (TIGR02999 family)